MNTKSLFNEIIDSIKILYDLVIKIFFHPDKITNKSFSYTKKEKFKNKYIYLLSSCLGLLIIVLNFFSDFHGAKNIVYILLNSSIVIIINSPTILTLTLLDYDIKEEYKKIFFLTIFSVSLLISIFQIVLLYFYLSFENYFFYYSSLLFGLIRLFWLCFIIPVKRNKRKPKSFKFIRLISAILIFFSTNAIINCILLIGITDKRNLNEIAFINDPILTETFNETEFVIQKSGQLNNILKKFCDYSLTDLYENPNSRKVIIQEINIFLIENNQLIRNRYANLKYKKSQNLYKGLIENLDNLTTISKYCEQVLDFNFEETKRVIQQKEIERQEYEKIIKKNKEQIDASILKIDNLSLRFDFLISKIEEIEEKTPNTRGSNNLFEKNDNSQKTQATNKIELINNSLESEIENIDRMINSTYTELEQETLSELLELLNELKNIYIEAKIIAEDIYETQQFFDETKKKINNINIEIQKMNNNKVVIEKIIYLIQTSEKTSNKELEYVEKILKFVDFRLCTFYL